MNIQSAEAMSIGLDAKLIQQGRTPVYPVVGFDAPPMWGPE